MTQQNPSNCIQFTVEIIFDDGSTILLDSLNSFLHYNEVRPIISTGLVLTWTYLVKFRDKPAPEKQVIVVTFGVSKRIIKDRIRLIKFLGEEISFRVEHTARTWGADIEALLTNHITNILKKENKYKKFAREKSDSIGMSTGLLIILCNIIVTSYKTSKFTEQQMAIASSILKEKTIDNITLLHKLDYVINYLASGKWHRFYNNVGTTFLIYLIVAIVSGFVLSSSADNHEPSFVLFTKKAIENKTIVLEKQKRKWLTFIASLILSIVIGILSNIIYALYFQK